MRDFTALNNFFDHIYVITLHRAQERQAAIIKNLAGLKYEFFWGADKQDHTASDMSRDGVYDERLAIINHRYHKAMSHGQICCSWSHKNVYQDVLIRGYQKVLILEDDVIAGEEIDSVAALIFEELPDNWELLYLDYNKNEVRNILKQYWYHVQRFLGGLTWSHSTIRNLYPRRIKEHLSMAGYHDYTSAYAITTSAAQKLLQLQTPISYVADNLLAMACSTKIINGLISQPKLFCQLSQGSGKFTHSFVDD